ncbi:MAG: Rho termination factor N-terminal domain-containing protein, partial [Alphaproteobacteria bacterium]
MHLEDLKQKTPVQLIDMAEDMEIDNVASMRK